MLDKKKIKNYIIWGALATFVNIGLFQGLIVLGMDYKIANLLAVLFNRFFAYVTNKMFVFKTKCRNKAELIKEMLAFFTARFATLLLDFFSVFILVEYFALEALISKVITTVIVVVTNYILSDWFVFKREGM